MTVDVPGDFTIYPNPIQSGEDIHVYMNTMDDSAGEIELIVSDAKGKIVKKIRLSPEGGSYLISNQLSRGLYNIIMNQAGQVLHKRKFIVQ